MTYRSFCTVWLQAAPFVRVIVIGSVIEIWRDGVYTLSKQRVDGLTIVGSTFAVVQEVQNLWICRGSRWKKKSLS